MNRSARTCVVVAVGVFCLVILCLSTSEGQNRKSYEVPAQIYGVPAWHSDAAYAVDAYERLMQRYTDLTERNMVGITADLGALARRLDAIDARLTALDARLAGIEQRLGSASGSALSPVSQVNQPLRTPELAPIQPDAKRPAPIDDAPPVPAPPAGNFSPAPKTVE